MNANRLRYLSAAVAAAAVVAVSGCGGGSGTRPDAENVVQSGQTGHPNSVLDRRWAGPSVQAEDGDSRVTSVELVDPSDGAGGVNVTYVLDGTTHQISFAASEFNPDPNQLTYETTRGRTTFGMWDYHGLFTNNRDYDHLDVNGWFVCTHPTATAPCAPDQAALSELRALRGYVVHGDPTQILPSGMATYEGGVRMDSYPSDNPNNAAQLRYRGRMMLNADFDGHSVAGMFNRFTVQAPGGNRDASDIEYMIGNGTIANNRISADLVGQTGTDAAGFTGSMDGQFYGPDAAEVGGTIAGTQDTRVFHGFFAGDKQQ